MSGRNRLPQHSDARKGFTLIIVGLCFLVPSQFHFLKSAPSFGLVFTGVLLTGLGLLKLAPYLPKLLRFLPFPKPLPKKEVMKLAEARNGILTLSETATALDIDPALAMKTLQALSKMGIATQRWQDFRKNVWEFPDYIRLPIAETIDLAKKKGGRISLSDLVASGQSMEVATQTLDTLSQKGLAQQDPAAGTRAVILTSQ
ncbi:MAG TPA: hypothetical protein VM008_15870 [Phycisphaerae bacterium]|nr:hypothetical protein [Phycisphaerae bacterium]